MTMDTESTRLRAHIKVLYLWLTILLLSFATEVWITQNRFLKFSDEISKFQLHSGVEVENKLRSNKVAANSTASRLKFVPNPTQKPARLRKRDVEVRLMKEDDSPDYGSGENKEKYEENLKFAENGNAEQDVGGRPNVDDMYKPTTQKPKQLEGNNDDWMWIPAYTRIPTDVLTKFCKSAQLYCQVAGPRGLQGLKGATGERGLMGPTGPTGAQGDDGPPGQIGSSGPQGPTGPVGADGAQGATGDKGDRGEIGLPGRDGIDGVNGINGLDGRDGEQGPAGATGDKGDRGEIGLPGRDGIDGVNGINGLDGRNGEQGPAGPQGPTGPVGPLGHKGDAGKIGVPGPKGEQGVTGQNGLDGFRGEDGFPGLPGAKGEAGDPGTIDPLPPIPGPPGEKGDQGVPGVCDEMCKPYGNLTYQDFMPTPAAVLDSAPPFPPRARHCQVQAIGTPVFQRYTGTFWGAWMTDPKPLELSDRTKIWTTHHFHGKYLNEYNDLEHFLKDNVTKKYDLRDRYYGTGHSVYQGSFYYQKGGHNVIIKYELASGIQTEVLIVNSSFTDGKYVYNTEYNYYDIAIDENGLWLIYGLDTDNATLVIANMSPNNLQMLKKWEIAVRRSEYGNGFIVCGILYLVKAHDTRTHITFAYDLFKNVFLTVEIMFKNPYKMNNMISYSYLENRLYGWDNGNQLTYPLLLG